MSLRRQNKNGDFVYHINFLDEEGGISRIPDSFSIEFSTETGRDTFTAMYNVNGKSSGCKVADGGLDVFIPLSRFPIGSGRMLATITTYRSVEGFESGTQQIRSKTTTNVILWDGNSDNAITIEGDVVLATNKP